MLYTTVRLDAVLRARRCRREFSHIHVFVVYGSWFRMEDTDTEDSLQRFMAGDTAFTLKLVYGVASFDLGTPERGSCIGW